MDEATIKQQMDDLMTAIQKLNAPFEERLEKDVASRLEVNGEIMEDAVLFFEKDGTAYVRTDDRMIVSPFGGDALLEVLETEGSVRIALVEGTVIQLFVSPKA